MFSPSSTLQGIVTETQKMFLSEKPPCPAISQEFSPPVFGPAQRQRKVGGKPGRQTKRLQTGQQ